MKFLNVTLLCTNKYAVSNSRFCIAKREKTDTALFDKFYEFGILI